MRPFPSMPITHRGTLLQGSEHLSISFSTQCADRRASANTSFLHANSQRDRKQAKALLGKVDRLIAGVKALRINLTSANHVQHTNSRAPENRRVLNFVVTNRTDSSI
jgi:hypothetical protein